MYTMVINDPKKFSLLSNDMQKRFLQAGKNTVNMQAALARKNAIKLQKEQFITRNTFTARNTQFTKCPDNIRRIGKIHAETGATEKAAYMERQETGGMHKPEQGTKLSIPTDMARNGGKKTGTINRRYSNSAVFSRRRKVHGAMRRSGTRSSNSVARAYIAFKKGLFLPFGSGIYVVTSFSKTGGKIRFKKQLVRNLKFRQTQTKSAPWLRPASEQPKKDCQAIFNSQIKKLENKKM